MARLPRKKTPPYLRHLMFPKDPHKFCTRCSTAKGLGDFGKRKSAKDGLDSWCKSCRNAHHKAWVASNKERYLSYALPIWKANSARWRAACRTRVNPEHTKEITKIYRECPKGHHVDHIIPLHGKTVSGLHVPWNLQYLPAKDNQRKSNSFAE